MPKRRRARAGVNATRRARAGVNGTLAALHAVIEANARGSLHAHLSPALLRAAVDDDALLAAQAKPRRGGGA